MTSSTRAVIRSGPHLAAQIAVGDDAGEQPARVHDARRSPRPFADISTSASDIIVPSGFSGTASPLRMRSLVCLSIAPNCAGMEFGRIPVR